MKGRYNIFLSFEIGISSLWLKVTSKNVIPAPIYIGINSSRNHQIFEITGTPPEFTPYLIRGGSDKLELLEVPLILCGLFGSWS